MHDNYTLFFPKFDILTESPLTMEESFENKIITHLNNAIDVDRGLIIYKEGHLNCLKKIGDLMLAPTIGRGKGEALIVEELEKKGASPESIKNLKNILLKH